MFWGTLLFALCSAVPFAQGIPPGPRSDQSPDSPNILRTPDGRNRTELILKADQEASLKDIETISQLAEQVKMEMEKNDHHILSVATLKKLDQIEKLTKKIRGRMKRF